MRMCNGPCDQGRLPCPTTDACWIQEERKTSMELATYSVLIAIFVGLVVFVTATLMSL